MLPFLAGSLGAELSRFDPARYRLPIAVPDVEHARIQSGVELLPGEGVAVDLVSFEDCGPPSGRSGVVLLVEAEIAQQSARSPEQWQSTVDWALALASQGLTVVVGVVPEEAGEAWVGQFLAALRLRAPELGLNPDRLGLWLRGRSAELALGWLASGPPATTGIVAAAAIAGVGELEKLPQDVKLLLVIPGKLPPERLESSRKAAAGALSGRLPWRVVVAPALGFGYDWLDSSEEARRTVEEVLQFLARELGDPPGASPPEAAVELERERWKRLLAGEAEAVHAAWNDTAGAQESGDPQLWRALAFARRVLGSPVGEMVALEQAVSLEPDRIDQRRRFGKLAGRLGGWQYVEEAYGPIGDRPELDALDLGLLGLALLRFGKPAEAVPVLERAVRLGGEPATRYNLACAYALVGRKEEAFAALEGAVAAGFSDRNTLEADPDLASLRSEPRFSRILDSLGAPERKPTRSPPGP